MATYTKPDQNIQYWIPDDGEVFYTGSGKQALYGVRQGNNLITTSADNLQSMGFAVPANARQVSDSDFSNTVTTFNSAPGLTRSGTFTADMYSAFNSTPKSSGETLTRGTSETNPNAGTLSSSISGDLTPASTPKYGQPGAINPTGMTPEQINPAGFGKTQQVQQTNSGVNIQSQTDENGNIISQTSTSLANGIDPKDPRLEAMKQQLLGAQRSLSNIGAPAQSSIGNPVTPPTGGGATSPSLPTPNAGSAADLYTQSLSAQIESQKKAFEAENAKRTADYDKKIADLEKKQADLAALQDLGMADMKSTVANETAEKRAAYDLEKQRFELNYNANQALVSEMDGLLTMGNQVIQQMKDTTGLASIMEPRIAKTMSDVAARAGVIQAVLSARNNQIGVAQNQLSSSLNAIESIYNDQIDYYKTLQDFYSNRRSENGALLATLNKEQKGYLDMKLTMLADDLENARATTDMVSKAMMDPDTALAYGQAGVSLTDSPQQIAQKLAVYAEANAKQWTDPYLLGGDYVQQNKVTGELRVAVNVPAGGGGTYVSSGGGGYQPGQLTALLKEKGMRTDDDFLKALYFRATEKTDYVNDAAHNALIYKYMGGKIDEPTAASRPDPKSNYTATTIPSNVQQELIADINEPGVTIAQLYAAYPDVSTSYVNSLYNSLRKSGGDDWENY